MNVIKLYRALLFLYAFLLIFGILHHVSHGAFYDFSLYENIVYIIFLLSVITVLGSVILLISLSILSLNKKIIQKTEIIYLLVDIVFYYGVIWVSLYLSTQCRL